MRKTLFLLSASLVLVLATGCTHTGAGFQSKGQFAELTAPVATVAVTNQLDPELLKAGKDFFTLGPGDRLEIEVVGQINTRTQTFVGPDGKIYYHLLPGLDVWGLTVPQTRELLEKELGKYLSSPQVAVTLREVASKYVWNHWRWPGAPQGPALRSAHRIWATCDIVSLCATGGSCR